MFMRFFVFFIYLTIFLHSYLKGGEGENKIVYLISGPRSLSTVFLRMMESRGDFIIYNEPTIPVFHAVNDTSETKGWFREDANTTFDEVKRKIFESSLGSHVFIKDMSFSSHEFIVNDEEFMKNSSINFLFLVRNPHHSSISFYNRVKTIFPEMSDYIGLEKLYKEYEAVKKVNPNGVKILLTEQLYLFPKEMMVELCHTLAIPFSENCFIWKEYDQNFQGYSEWNEQKIGNHIHLWHGRAIQSRQLEMPNSYALDGDGNPSFSEIENDEHRSEIEKIYRENLLYYNKFIDAYEDHLLEE